MFVQVNLILLNNGPKHKSCDADNSNIPKRSFKVLPLSEKIHMYRKKNSINMVQYNPRSKFQASIRGLGRYLLRIREDTVLYVSNKNSKVSNTFLPHS